MYGSRASSWMYAPTSAKLDAEAGEVRAHRALDLGRR
jgi:hypothetical protein